MIIEAESLSKTYVLRKKAGRLKRERTTVEAVRDLNLAVAEGELLGYIGPNGAGKSTTIKVMSGILTPDAGACTVMDYIPWKQRREYVRNIGVVFGQRTQLWWDVPVQDSFELLRHIYKIPVERYSRNLGMLVDMLDMGGLMATPLRQLSLASA